MTGEQKSWDLEKVHDEKISPLMNEIIRVCKEHEMPCLVSFEYTPGSFCTTFLQFDGKQTNYRLRAARDIIYKGFNFLAGAILRQMGKMN